MSTKRLWMNKVTHRFSCSIGKLIRKSIKFFIEGDSSLSLRLFHFNFVFISVAILSFSVSGFVKLYICSFSIELDVLGRSISQNLKNPQGKGYFCFLLSDHNWRLEMKMDKNNQFIIAGLKK